MPLLPERGLARRTLVAVSTVAATTVGLAALGEPGSAPAAPSPEPSVIEVRASSAVGSGVQEADPVAEALAPTPGSAPPLVAADRMAGVLTRGVPQAGTGHLVVVPGSSAAPRSGPVRTVRVEVEVGVPVEGATFADFVLQTLNDPRGWGHGGTMTFARTDADAEIVVQLASPDTSRALCRPLETFGNLSCRSGSRAIITHYRWVHGHPDYHDDLTGYRRYVVNHEVGHVLGHGHEPCGTSGEPAPVMQQQTKGLRGCLPNPWPFP